MPESPRGRERLFADRLICSRERSTRVREGPRSVGLAVGSQEVGLFDLPHLDLDGQQQEQRQSEG